MSERESLQIEIALKGMAALQADFKRATEYITELGEKAARIGEAGAELLGLYEIGRSVKEVLEYGRALEVLQSQTGASIPDLVILQQLLATTGEGADEAGMMIARMQRSMVDAAEEGGAALTVFQQLFGKDAMAKLAGLDVGGQFRAIGEAIGRIENPAKRAQIAMEIFGRSGYTLLRLFPKLTELEAKAKEGHEEFAQVLSRGGEMFRSMEVALQMLGQMSREFFAGLIDSIGPMFEGLFDKIASFDLTKVGQRMGAFVGVVIQSIRDDRFPEMLGLLIEAGFELGAQAAKGIIKDIGAFFESNAFASAFVALSNGVMTLGVKTAEVLVSGFAILWAYLKEGFVYAFDNVRELVETLGQQLKHVFAVAINFWAAGIEGLVNKLAGNKYFQALLDIFTPGGANLASSGGIHLGRVSEATWPVAPGMTSETAFNKIVDTYTSIPSRANAYLQTQLEASRQILHLSTQVTAADKGQGDALARVNALIDAQLAKRKALGAGEGGETVKGGIAQTSTDIQRLLDVENAAKDRIAEIREGLARAETDFTLTAQEKYAVRKKLLTEEAEQLRIILVSMQRREDLLQQIGRYEDAQRIHAEIPGAKNQVTDAERQKAALGPDPNSFAQQWVAAIAKMESAWGTLAEMIANSFTKTVNGAISAVSSNLTDVIMRTKTWAMALRDIGTSVMKELIQQIIQMGIQYVLTHVIIRGAMMATNAIGQALGWSAVASTNAQEAAKAPALAANAASASVGSFGTSAIIGTVAAIAAFGLITAAALGAFAEGGYTGAGGKFETAGLVHRGEFVMPASAVQRIGLPRLEAMRQGAGGAGVNIPMISAQPHQINVFDDRSDLAKHIRNNPEARHSIVDLVAGNTRAFLPRRMG